jgi:hypothetical protein
MIPEQAMVQTAANNNDIVPAQVKYNDRKFTDKLWGLLYSLTYVAYLTMGFIIIGKAKPRYKIDEQGTRTISDHYMEEAVQCCIPGDKVDDVYGEICYNLETTANGARVRRLAAGNSKFDGDEGIFDAFLEAPEIICGLVGLALGSAVLWVVLMRYFAKPIVFLTEFFKIAAFIILAIFQKEVGTKVVCSLIAVGIAAYTWWARKQIIFAAKMLKHSTVAMKENPSIFAGALLSKVFYAANAGFFVWFFAKSFDVAEVSKTEYCYTDYYSNQEVCYEHCNFEYPDYIYRMNIFISLSYLWTILYLNQFRLAIISTIVGSWHFHPENKPSLLTTIKTSVHSLGTISVTSLIASIAEKFNKMIGEDCFSTWVSPTVCITGPFQCLLLLVGTCFKNFIRMLTSYALILHMFTGNPFLASAKQVFNILSRHFKNGFVTDYTSRSVISLGSYVFSMIIAIVAWVWIDARFDCNTLPGGDLANRYAWILYFLVFVSCIWFPVLGLYVIILVNRYVQKFERSKMERIENTTPPDDDTYYFYQPENLNHYWIPPLAAVFVGCISMMFFEFFAGIFIDIIDTLFLCFAIDKDNNVASSNTEFQTLIETLPVCIASNVGKEDLEDPIAVGVPVAATVHPTAPSQIY